MSAIDRDRLELESFVESPLARFRAWRAGGRSPQGEFIAGAERHRIRIFRAGNRSGKSTCGAVDTLLHVLGWHPRQVFAPPLKWWVSGLSFGVIGEVVWPKIKAMLPEDQVAAISWLRRRDEIPLSVTFRNGSEITFKSADQGREKYQGADLHGIWLDEEHPGDVVEECRARLMDYGGFLSGTFTPLARHAWVQELEAEPDTLTVRASMLEALEAGLLDRASVERYSRALTERQRRVRIFGDFVARQGAVYGDFDRSRHCATVRDGALWRGRNHIAPWPIPPGWRRYRSVDFGYANPSAFLQVAECPHTGRAIVERLYYQSEIRISRWAELLADPDRWGSRRVSLVCDHDANGRAELEALGFATRPANKTIDTGLETVERFLANEAGDGAPMLILALTEEHDDALGRVDAERLAWEFGEYRYPEARAGTDAKDAPVKKDDHALDALRYLLVDFEKSHGGPPLPPGYEPDAESGRSIFDGRRSLFENDNRRDRHSGFAPRLPRR